MLKRLTVTFTDAERLALDQLAQLEVRPVKEQVRFAVREAAQVRGLWPAPSQPACDLVRNDEPVVVTHYNRAVAVIMPLAEYERITGQIFHYARPDDGEAGFMQDGQRVV